MSRNEPPATVILLFDMFGYEELFDETGGVRSACTNSRHSANGRTFPRSESVGISTAVSLPGFMVQKHLGTNGWEVNWKFSDWGFADGTNMLHIRDSLGQSLPDLAGGAGADDMGYDERVSLVTRVGKLLRETLSPGDFAFVHMEMPHNPYLVGHGGQLLALALHWDDEEDLVAQSEGADWTLGELMEVLESTLEGWAVCTIVTSDHNLHKNRYLRGRKTRSLPGAQSGADVTS